MSRPDLANLTRAELIARLTALDAFFARPWRKDGPKAALITRIDAAERGVENIRTAPRPTVEAAG